MKRRIFLMSLVFLFLISLVAAQDCLETGVLNGTHYCDTDMEYKLLKSNGEACVNYFECFNQSCIDELCQTRYANVSFNLTERAGLIGDILNLIQGVECNPANQTYHCVGKEAFLCGANFVWESKGEIEGVCGVGEESHSSGGGGGSGSIPFIIFYSPLNGVSYPFSQIPLQVADSKKKFNFWEYSLNNDSRVAFIPNTTISLSKPGNNSLVVFARISNHSTYEIKRAVTFSFSAPGSTSYCGDGACQANESCETCDLDCGLCTIIEYSLCGDDLCDEFESSYNCTLDCIAKERTDYTPVAIGVAASSIAVLGFVLYRRFFSQGAMELLDTRKH